MREMLMVGMVYVISQVMIVRGMATSDFMKLIDFLAIAFPIQMISQVIFGQAILDRKFSLTCYLGCFLFASAVVIDYSIEYYNDQS